MAYEVVAHHHEKWNGRGSDFDPVLVDVFMEVKDKIQKVYEESRTE